MGLPNILPQLPGVSNLVNNIVARNVLPSTPSGPWYPPQWSNSPAMVSITATIQGQTTSTYFDAGTPGTTPVVNSAGVPIAGALSTQTQNVSTTYVFDAVLSLEHDQRLVTTEHPIQTGADISSHAYLMPAHLVLYVGMSDVMASYGPWSGNPSKSVAAYQQMIALQASRLPLTVVTRLRTYTNMVILSISPREDSRTITGLRMRVEFAQIFTASTAAVPNSARVNDTASTGLGTINATPVKTAVQNQFGVGTGTGGSYSSSSGPQIVTGTTASQILGLQAAGLF